MNKLIYKNQGARNIESASLERLPINVRVYHYNDYGGNYFGLFADCLVSGQSTKWLEENSFYVRADTEIILDQVVQKYIAPIYRKLVFNAENFTYLKK